MSQTSGGNFTDKQPFLNCPSCFFSAPFLTLCSISPPLAIFHPCLQADDTSMLSFPAACPGWGGRLQSALGQGSILHHVWKGPTPSNYYNALFLHLLLLCLSVTKNTRAALAPFLQTHLCSNELVGSILSKELIHASRIHKSLTPR